MLFPLLPSPRGGGIFLCRARALLHRLSSHQRLDLSARNHHPPADDYRLKRGVVNATVCPCRMPSEKAGNFAQRIASAFGQWDLKAPTLLRFFGTRRNLHVHPNNPLFGAYRTAFTFFLGPVANVTTAPFNSPEFRLLTRHSKSMTVCFSFPSPSLFRALS